MKQPSRNVARFVNWVEGEEVFPVPEEAERNQKPRKKKTPVKAKPASPEKEKRIFALVYDGISVVVCLTVILTLLVTVSWLPRFGGQENPAENEVYTRYLEGELEDAGATYVFHTIRDMADFLLNN